MPCIKLIANIVHSIFTENKYSTGFWVLIYSETADFAKDKLILKFSTNQTAKMEVKLRCINNQFFLCHTNINAHAFYENLMNKMRHLRKCFPDHQNSFREELIKRL